MNVTLTLIMVDVIICPWYGYVMQSGAIICP